MPDYIYRYAGLFEKSGWKFRIMNGVLWHEYQKMVQPLGPVKAHYSLTQSQAKELFSFFPDALLARYTDWPQEGVRPPNGEWYAVICDKFLDTSEMSKKKRYQVNHGCKNFVVKRITPAFLAEHGYAVFAAAMTNYGFRPDSFPAREEFAKSALKNEGFEDIVHIWGAFHEDKLAAYSIRYTYGKMESNTAVSKYHPDYLKYHVSHALIHTTDEYYLKECGFEYVNSGFCNILHQTNSMSFRIETFGFRKAPVTLYMRYKPLAGLAMRLAYPFRSVLGLLDSRAKALFALEAIRRSQL